DFVQRQQFGRYLRTILKEAVEAGLVQVARHQAISAEPSASGWSVRLDDGQRVDASALVLALGNQPPEPLPFGQHSARVINNPWGGEALAAVEDLASSHEDVLLVGTGLTMVDAVLSLDA